MMMNRFKRVIGVVMAAAMSIAMVGCGVAQNADAAEQEKEVVGMPNPFVDVTSLNDASKIAGFCFNAPDKLYGYEGVIIQAIENDLIQVIYGDLDHNVCFRKGVITDGNTDISGDYNDYKDVETRTEGGKSITIKGDGNLTHVIIWNEGDYCYAIQSNSGYNYDDVSELIQLAQ